MFIFFFEISRIDGLKKRAVLYMIESINCVLQDMQGCGTGVEFKNVEIVGEHGAFKGREPKRIVN